MRIKENQWKHFLVYLILCIKVIYNFDVRQDTVDSIGQSLEVHVEKSVDRVTSLPWTQDDVAPTVTHLGTSNKVIKLLLTRWKTTHQFLKPRTDSSSGVMIKYTYIKICKACNTCKILLIFAKHRLKCLNTCGCLGFLPGFAPVSHSTVVALRTLVYACCKQRS